MPCAPSSGAAQVYLASSRIPTPRRQGQPLHKQHLHPHTCFAERPPGTSCLSPATADKHVHNRGDMYLGGPFAHICHPPDSFSQIISGPSPYLLIIGCSPTVSLHMIHLATPGSVMSFPCHTTRMLAHARAHSASAHWHSVGKCIHTSEISYGKRQQRRQRRSERRGNSGSTW